MELKLVYGLKITFELEVSLIGCGDDGFVEKYNQNKLTLFFDYLRINLLNFAVKNEICTIHAKICYILY